ncbi:MAG TPA: hypothetical protein VM536_20845 [Chloroflexia bacterium]|nr:hypothetical protein [Chloroflexia bacterium]
MRYETHTHLKPEQVLDEAETFFGDAGLKMKKSARQGNQVSFYGPGLAWITVWPPNNEKSGSRVDLDSSERDADVLRFREHLHSLEHKAGSPMVAPPSGDPGPR